MRYRRFGRTELAMPVFSCGGMRFQQSWRSDAVVEDARQRHLEATVDRALALGLHHFETARGYGTSEAQLGPALARHPRASFILQTKGPPREDPREFERNLEESFRRLRVDRLDLFAFHGLNDRRFLDWTLRPGGCLEIAERFRREGRIGHLGFSTHARCSLIVEAIETGRFDYVNLHYYFIRQDNAPAIAAAKRQDMGVFIISPTDKGGRLQAPSDRLRALCAPLSPMAFNDLFCLAHDGVHTLSLGAARPSDFDEHVAALDHLDDAPAVIEPIVARLEAAYADAVGIPFARHYLDGVPEWDALPNGVNARLILWLRNLVLAYDLLEFARERYANLTGHDHWVPGAQAADLDEPALRRALAGARYAEEIPALLREAHAWLA
jgi:predicted aldo/keto reductase-like oxidoreductase